jgi:serine/threonine protein kinase
MSSERGLVGSRSQRIVEEAQLAAPNGVDVLEKEALEMIGTLADMSPEQAELANVDIDTRSDSFSLGVLRYELMTGTTPIDAARLRSASFGEIQRRSRRRGRRRARRRGRLWSIRTRRWDRQ